ncbi:MAG: hypothetical protein ACFNUN_09210 [Aggregatibacter sp.]|uniref:hypothetical protein n=1 Tax=Aggregatibacter sp. TaxID=1872413 RepID=UPI00361B07E3
MHSPRSVQLVARKCNNSSQKSAALIRRRRERADRTIDVSFGVNGGKKVQGYLDELTAP